MSNTEATSTASTTGGRERRQLTGITTICKQPYNGQIHENVTSYSDHFVQSGDREEDFDYKSRNEKTGDIVENFYTLVTDFYEYGYGRSFHFAPVFDGKSFEECIAEFEDELAKTLNARPGMKILVSWGIWCTCIYHVHRSLYMQYMYV